MNRNYQLCQQGLACQRGRASRQRTVWASGDLPSGGRKQNLWSYSQDFIWGTVRFTRGSICQKQARTLRRNPLLRYGSSVSIPTRPGEHPDRPHCIKCVSSCQTLLHRHGEISLDGNVKLRTHCRKQTSTGDFLSCTPHFKRSERNICLPCKRW